MAIDNVTPISLTIQELHALREVIELSFLAFDKAHYPTYFVEFLQSIVLAIRLGSAATIKAAPAVDALYFSEKVDCLAVFIKKADELISGINK